MVIPDVRGLNVHIIKKTNTVFTSAPANILPVFWYKSAEIKTDSKNIGTAKYKNII